MKWMKGAALIAAILVIGSTQAEAGSIRVSQESAPGAGDFDANILGFVTPFATGLTAAGLYSYGVPSGASYNGEDHGGPTMIDMVSQLFLVDGSDGLSLFIVHDSVDDGTGGVAATRYDLSGDTASIGVKDDGGESYTDDGSTFTASHAWIDCCTDGYTIGSLDGTWEMIGGFLTAPTGLSRWLVTSSNGSETTVLTLEGGRRVRLDTVPEPGTMALFGLGLLGLGGIVRRRRNAA